MNAIPAAAVPNVRNDMYLASRRSAWRRRPTSSAQDAAALKAYRGAWTAATKFIPDLGEGGGRARAWSGHDGRLEAHRGDGGREDRQEHLTYGQGASAEFVAMATIGAADVFGLPVSTTHVLSSGVAGTMLANGSGLQWGTIAAWRWPGF